jgi:hypothetical protein
VQSRSPISLPQFQPEGVLKFLLPFIVHERVFAGTHGRFGLLHLRPKVVIAQLDEQIARPHWLIVGNRYCGYQAGYFRAEWRQVCLHVRIVRALPTTVANPLIPIARDQN